MKPKTLRLLTLDELKSIISTELSLLEEEKKPGYDSVSTKTNIADLDVSDAYSQLTSGDETAPLILAMMTATKWASGAIKGAGGASAIKDWAQSVGEADLAGRISKVAAALPGSAPAKKDMPALEGDDAPQVKDALSAGGKYNVDTESTYAGDTPSVDEWIDTLSDEDLDSLKKGAEPKIASESTIKEDKYPRHGMSAMPGGDPILPVGKALAFLVKGKHDGNLTDDNIDVKINSSIPNSKMVPTQSNILAGKSLLFAFLQGVGKSDLSDMGGAFVTSAGEILDGHHRWSGAFIGTGGGLTHSNVNVVSGDADELIPLLTSIGNALGNPQKENSELIDDIIMERWRKIAGILKG